MNESNDLGQSRLDSLYVIAEPTFDTLENAVFDLETLLGLQPTETGKESNQMQQVAVALKVK